MLVIIGILVWILSWVSAMLFSKIGMEHPAFFWFVGFVGGIISGMCIGWKK